MHQTPVGRLLALLLTLSLAAIACTSSATDEVSSTDADITDTDDADSSTDADNTDETEAGNDGDTDADAEADEPGVTDLTGPADPESARTLLQQLTGLPIEDETVTCMTDNADGDTTLTAILNGWQEQTFQFTPEVFTALTVNAHDCIDPVLLGTSLTSLAGDSPTAAEFTSCIATEFENDATGDLAYTGLAALQINFPIPEGAQEATRDLAVECITDDILSSQLAVSREQASGFTVEVDRECVIDGLDESFRTAFWDGVVTSSQEANDDLETLLEACSTTYDSGLPTEVPADFVEFAGEGVLAGIDPLSRNGLYTAAPEMILEDGVDYQAVITTDDGEIVIDLYEDIAPITVNSFVALAQDGYYDKTVFHRVLDGFMAQAGDPTGTGSGGPGYSFDDEESGLTPIDRRGLLAMANSGEDTNGSQFFITLEAADWLNGLHTVFGEVIEGDDVLAAIELRDPDFPTSRGEELISVEILTS